MSHLLHRARRALREPRAALRYVLGRLRGELYRALLPRLGYRFEAGPGLLVPGRLVLRGPGRVVFGRGVQVWERVTPWTYSEDAVIRVGDRSVLAGTRFGCQQEISIGADCIVADGRIMDTDFHSLHAHRHDDEAPIVVKPVRIDDNVWIAAQTGLLPGTEIGRDSVVAFGSVCSRRFQAGVIIAGNPARPAGKVPGAAAAEGSASARPRAGGAGDEEEERR